jgi:single-stranded DNA-binding protein
VRAFNTLAENVVESLAKGDRVFVHRDRHHRGLDRPADRRKRTAQRVLAETVGPSRRWATTRLTKTTQTGRGAATDE